MTEHFDAFYLGAINYKKKNIQNDREEEFSISHYLRVPGRLQNSSLLFRIFDFILVFMQFQVKIAWFRPRIIWLTSPEVSRYLTKSQLKRSVFDYMDAYEFLTEILSVRGRIRRETFRLLKNCRVAFASSNHLYEDAKRNGAKCFIINNALKDDFLDSLGSGFNKSGGDDPFIRLVYVGTISHWLDKELILELSNVFAGQIIIDLYGPSEIDLSWLPENVVHKGVVPHSAVALVIENADVCIMPFVVNDLIEAVDPVKIYEYIAMGKFILCPAYDELNKFGLRLRQYRDHQDCIEIIRNFINKEVDVHATNDVNLFIRQNCWSHRAASIIEILEEN